MTMPVFALITPVVVLQPLTQGRPTLTDYSDGQQQSYSEDVTALLAAMDTALSEPDTQMQPLPEAIELNDQVQSMLPQPLLFAPFPASMEILPVPQASEPVMPTPVSQPVIQALSEEEWVAPVFIAAGTQSTKLSKPPAWPIAVMPLPSEQNTALTQDLLLSHDHSAELPASHIWPVSQHATDLRVQKMSSLTSVLSQNLASQFNTLAPVKSQVSNTEFFTPIAAAVPAHNLATPTLPVWQADPISAQSQHWGQRLVQMLADKVDLQLGLNVNKALIRLDPPSLGSIELSVQLDGDRLTVQMHSSNAQLREAMGQGLEQLRVSLQQKLGADVQIELRMGTESSSQQKQHSSQQQLTQQLEANFYAEPDTDLPAVLEVSSQNLMNQLV